MTVSAIYLLLNIARFQRGAGEVECPPIQAILTHLRLPDVEPGLRADLSPVKILRKNSRPQSPSPKLTPPGISPQVPLARGPKYPRNQDHRHLRLSRPVASRTNHEPETWSS